MAVSKKMRIWLYCIMTMLFWFANYAFVPYLSTYAASLSAGSALIGLMLGSYGWAQLTLRIPVGILSDQYNNRRIFIQAGCLLNACNLLGQMFASIAAMPVTAAFGVKFAFLLAAAVGVIPFFISLTLKDKVLDRKPLQFKALLAVGRTRWVLVISSMAILCQTMTFATTTGFTPQLALRLGARTSMLAWILLLSTMGGAIFSLLSSRVFVDRFGARNSLVALLFVQAVTCILQPLAPSLITLFIIVFFNGIARGTSISLMLGLVVMPFPYEKQTAAMGFYQALYSLGIILGPTIAGAVMQVSGLSAGFYVIGVIGLAAPVLGLAFIPDERKKLPAIA